jgi:hypothetical protein
MMLRLVLPGSRSEDGEGRVSKVFCWTLIEGADGLMGMGLV